MIKKYLSPSQFPLFLSLVLEILIVPKENFPSLFNSSAVQ